MTVVLIVRLKGHAGAGETLRSLIRPMSARMTFPAALAGTSSRARPTPTRSCYWNAGKASKRTRLTSRKPPRRATWPAYSLMYGRSSESTTRHCKVSDSIQDRRNEMNTSMKVATVGQAPFDQVGSTG